MIASLRVPGAGGAEHFVFLHVQDAARPNRSRVGKLAEVASAVLLGSDQGAVQRPLSLLAEGAVALLYSGWRDYCLARITHRAHLSFLEA